MSSKPSIRLSRTRRSYSASLGALEAELGWLDGEAHDGDLAGVDHTAVLRASASRIGRAADRLFIRLH